MPEFKFNIGDLLKVSDGVIIYPTLQNQKPLTDNLRVTHRFWDGMFNTYVVATEDGYETCILERNVELQEKADLSCCPSRCGVEVEEGLYKKLQALGIIPNEVRSTNVGESDYSEHVIQPWAIWQEYNLNAWDADIVKRVLRHKATEPRRKDYEKIIHDCRERIRQIDVENG